MPRGYAQLADVVWLRSQYLDQSRTLEEIANVVGCTRSAAYLALIRHGIPVRTATESRNIRGTTRHEAVFPQLRDVDWLRTRYIDDGLNGEEIAALIGSSRTAVTNAIRRTGIPPRVAGQIRPNHRRRDAIDELHDPDWLRQKRIADRRTVEEIAAELGCTPKTVTTWLKRWGIRWREPLPRGEAFAVAAPRRQRTSSGYWNIWSPNHPAANHKGFVGEHRLVAERELGRLLRRGEVVHHLNETPLDNRPENLMVFASNGAHMSFHANPPSWVPRCKCCGKPNPEVLSGRPPDVPMLYDG